jgi:phosphonate transport system substrate-binding protein
MRARVLSQGASGRQEGLEGGIVFYMDTFPNVLRFAFPPSLGERRASQLGAKLEAFLDRLLAPDHRVEVVVGESYQELASYVVAGSVQVAWAPPFVCARVENAGGRAVARARRGGASSFRSALLCHRSRPVKIPEMRGLRAAWVDRDSTAGYLLPRAYLRRQGIVLEKAFASERFVGSYHRAVSELAEGQVDLTAIYASSAGAARPYLGLEQLPVAACQELDVVAYTDETPNDALVVGPGAAAPFVEALLQRLLKASELPNGAEVLRKVFNADEFEPAPPKGYRALYGLALSGLQ